MARLGHRLPWRHSSSSGWVHRNQPLKPTSSLRQVLAESGLLKVVSSISCLATVSAAIVA
jgi:hypothetical protein